MDLFKPIEILEPLYNFLYTPLGGIIFFAVCVFAVFAILQKLQNETEYIFFIVIFLVFAVYIVFSGYNYHNQNISISTPQENSASVAKEQTESKDHTVNLKCTITKNGDYLCKKPK